MNKVTKIYDVLLAAYGPQGWWPLVNVDGSNPTKTGSVSGYHPSDYSYPKNKSEIFEIAAGSIATQNTTWVQAEKVIVALNKLNALTAENLLALDDDVLKDAMRPAGYFNQKTKKLKILAAFLAESKYKTPTREELLGLWGIGEETADSILLYAFSQLEFKVDAYAKRIFSRLGFFDSRSKYSEVKAFFEENIPDDFIIYQEYHALIVEHAKRSCLKSKPLCNDCFLKQYCSYL